MQAIRLSGWDLFFWLMALMMAKQVAIIRGDWACTAYLGFTLCVYGAQGALYETFWRKRDEK